MTARCTCGERIERRPLNRPDNWGKDDLRYVWVHVGSGQVRCAHGGNIAQPAKARPA